MGVGGVPVAVSVVVVGSPFTVASCGSCVVEKVVVFVGGLFSPLLHTTNSLAPVKAITLINACRQFIRSCMKENTKIEQRPYY